jgi:hypothetical protein
MGLGIGIGAVMLFGPTYSGCETHMSAPPPGQIAMPGPTVCYTKSLVEVQPVWPLPLIPILVWSLAPTLAYIGVRRRLAGRRLGSALVVTALVLESTVIISFGAAPLYVPFVLLPLVMTVIVALRTPAMR